jgi:hypothetical protein
VNAARSVLVWRTDQPNRFAGSALIAALLVAAAVLAIGPGDCGITPDEARAAASLSEAFPEAAGSSDLTGVYDAVVDGAIHCIVRLDQSGTNISRVAVCYGDIEFAISSSAAYLARMDGNFGPPPPPPYTPAWGNAAGTISGNNVSVATCVTLDGIALYLDVNLNKVTLAGSVYVYAGQTLANCSAGTPTGSPVELDMDFTERTDSDYDDDGCTDATELQANVEQRQGFDPYNPFDCDTNINSIFYLASTLTPETPTSPGMYMYCVVDIQEVQPSGSNPRMRPFCYLDSTSIVVNPADASGATTCPPAASSKCGDGILLPGPPPPYRPVPTNTSDAQLTGATQSGMFVAEGCFRFSDSLRVYVRARISSTTGQGTLDIWHNFTGGPDPCTPPPAAASAESGSQCTNATSDDGDAFVNDGCPQAGATTEVGSQCLNSTNDDASDDSAVNDGCSPQGADAPDITSAVLRAVEQGTISDADRDNCPDRNELSGAEGDGGRRDPLNRWDYMNPTHDGMNRVDDIVLVNSQYFKDDTDSNPGEPPFAPGYNQDTDRRLLVGGNAWNLDGPNGLQRVDDTVAMLNQYFHDCP